MVLDMPSKALSFCFAAHIQVMLDQQHPLSRQWYRHHAWEGVDPIITAPNALQVPTPAMRAAQ